MTELAEDLFAILRSLTPYHHKDCNFHFSSKCNCGIQRLTYKLQKIVDSLKGSQEAVEPSSSPNLLLGLQDTYRETHPVLDVPKKDLFIPGTHVSRVEYFPRFPSSNLKDSE